MRSVAGRRQIQRSDGLDEATNTVSAILRIRPLLPSESERGETANATALPDGQSLMVTAQVSQNRKIEAQQFRLDRVFSPATSQRDFFHRSGVESFCDAALEGMAATVFCFGQTGSGKTYTMSGPALTLVDGDDEASMTEAQLGEHAGLQVRASQYMTHVADEVNATGGSHRSIVIKASYIEIYNEAVNDLLNETENLKMRWSQSGQCFFIEGLMVVQCDNFSDLEAVLAEGNNNRKRASHKLNVDSSRSHCIFTIYVERRDVPGAPPKLGKIHFVDLAGSEKLKDSESSGVHGEETKNINRSLFTLGHVISCLAKPGGIATASASPLVSGTGGATGGGENSAAHYVPYRDSTLTKLLMDSLGGNSKTLMIACITPSNRFTEESLRTITYAMRTKNIVNATPTVRLDPRQQALYEMKVELEMLRKENASLRAQLLQQGCTPMLASEVRRPLPQPPPVPVRAWLGDVHQRSPSPIMPPATATSTMTSQAAAVFMEETSASSAAVRGLLPPAGVTTGLRAGSFLLHPPGTAQSSASAPAALGVPMAGGGGFLPVAQSPSSGNWTTSSVRSLPPLASSPLMPAGAVPAATFLNTQQHASMEIAGKIQKDNEELRREVALLRNMILDIKSQQQQPQPSPSSAPGGAGASSPLGSSTASRPLRVGGTVSSSQPVFRGRLEPPADGPAGATFERRISASDEFSGSPTASSATDHGPADARGAAVGELTEFGFRPAPKKLQRLNFS